MNSSKDHFSKVAGAIILLSALGIIILNLLVRKDMDSFIMPFILIMTGIVILRKKNSEASDPIQMSPRKRKVIITTLSVSLVGGIVTLIMTLL